MTIDNKEGFIPLITSQRLSSDKVNVTVSKVPLGTARRFKAFKARNGFNSAMAFEVLVNVAEQAEKNIKINEDE